MAIVRIGEDTLEVSTVGKRGPKRRRPDPIALCEADGSSRLFCPHDSASLVRLHGPRGHVFYGCSKYPECDYCFDGRRAAALKRTIRKAMRDERAMPRVEGEGA